MSSAVGKAIIGGVEMAAGAALAVFSLGTLSLAGVGLFMAGLSEEASAIAQAVGGTRGTNVTTRTAASYRQIVRGEQRIAGNIVYCSTTGSSKRQYNMVIVLATHPCESLVNLYLDGRQVVWGYSGSYWTGSGENPRNHGNFNFDNGDNFGGTAAPGTYVGPNGQNYSFGSEVFCYPHMGTETAATVYNNDLYANDPTWTPNANGTPYLAGCTWVYLKLEYDTGTFPSFPEIRFTVKGKNDIYDPRTGTRGYSTNWALQVADVVTDAKWGLGDNTVNQDQLIAAANVCDEQVACQGGSATASPWAPDQFYTTGETYIYQGALYTVNSNYNSGSTFGSADISHSTLTQTTATESRYCCHLHYDTATSPGDVLNKMMEAAGGRLSRIGGQWYVWPAYWQGPSFTFDADQLIAPLKWNAKRPLSELANRITGTYTAPNYPYNVAGDLYDSNGWWNGTIQNNFAFAFQPTDYPPYACDALHGYGAGVDVYLQQDGGIVLPMDLPQPCVLSISQAQRLAKIKLLRNRQQGSGSMMMSLPAWQMQATDVMYFNMPALNWLNKNLEVVQTKFIFKSGQGKAAPQVYVQVDVQETDPSVYEFENEEELTVYDVPAFAIGEPYIVPPVTALTAVIDPATAMVAQDGLTTPRALVQWTPPADTGVNNGGSIQVQYVLLSTLSGTRTPIHPGSLPTFTTGGGLVLNSSAWIDAGSFSGQATFCYIDIPTGYYGIGVQVQAVRASGATSVWVQDEAYTLGTPTPILRPQPQLTVGGLTGPIFTLEGTSNTLDQVIGVTGSAADENGNLQLKNIIQVGGITVNPSVSDSGFVDLAELGTSNSAMAVTTQGNPIIVSTMLAFQSQAAGGSTGPIASLGYTPVAVGQTSCPSISISIANTGGSTGTGASASVTWTQSGNVRTVLFWTPHFTLVGGQGYSAAQATITVSGYTGSLASRNGVYTTTCVLSAGTPVTGSVVQAQIVMDGLPVAGPVQATTDASGNTNISITQLLYPAAGVHQFEVEAQTTDTTHTVVSTARAFNLVELG